MKTHKELYEDDLRTISNDLKFQQNLLAREIDGLYDPDPNDDRRYQGLYLKHVGVTVRQLSRRLVRMANDILEEEGYERDYKIGK